ncbi:MAG: M13 family metallopeptidase [Acidobacteria bacterium]|nr:M13 family metallopeptidase [Acidobacteriota bacterium]
MSRLLLLAVVACASLVSLMASCASVPPSPATSTAALAKAPAAPSAPSAPDPERSGSLAPSGGGGRFAAVEAALDPAVDPCQDFYRYACGGWIKSTRLPADLPRLGRGFDVIYERNLAALREILEDVAADPADADRARLGTFYASCLDEDAIERAGAEPLAALLDGASKVDDAASLMSFVGSLHAQEIGGLFDIEVDPDFEDPTIDIAHLGQGGLGLPDRDYYLKDDEESQKLVDDYRVHVARMLGFLGEPERSATARADEIVAFETELAKVSRTRTEMRDLEKLYNRIDIDGLKQLTPGLPWDRYLQAIGFPGLQFVNVATPEFFAALEHLVAATPPEVLQAYLRWQIVHSAAPLLAKRFVNENFAFYGARLSGQQELPARWKRCVGATDASLGELLGRYYVEKHFPGDSKTVAREMVVGIERAFESGLPELAWMDGETRARASDKAGAIVNKIGYPDRWIDYAAVDTRPGEYFHNSIAARTFDFRRLLGKVGRAVDRNEWKLTPPEVNAYYSPLGNEMVFPAGILQPPFFDREFPAPMNFGGIGMVMGHELTHGFDDTGRKFDKSGRLVEWWSPAVSQRFEDQAQCLVDQYSGYEVQPRIAVNGQLTLGENIADLGGVKSAYRAFKEWERSHPGRVSESLTNDQLFFIGFAQAWCTLTAPEFERLLVNVDPHSPPQFRVNGPLSNFPEFGRAFSCPASSAMTRTELCSIW